MGSVEPIDRTSRDFARNLWVMLNDGGLWAVPRVGLTYRKDEAGRRMVLSHRMPWFEGLSVDANELRYRQDIDHQGVREMFFTIDIAVEEEV